MARSVTVGTMVDEVQVLIEDPLHKVASEVEYIRRIDRAAARLYRMYVEAEPDRYRTEATITGVSGTASYALPALWLGTIGIDAVRGTSREELERLHEENRNDYTGQSGTARAFRIVASNVVLYPTPITGQTYTHIYIPTAPSLTATSDTVDCRLGHEEWLEKWVARDLLKMKNEYAGQWDADLEQISSELKTEANWRYFTDVVTMQKSKFRRTWPYGGLGLELTIPRLPRA